MIVENVWPAISLRHRCCRLRSTDVPLVQDGGEYRGVIKQKKLRRFCLKCGIRNVY